MAKSFYRSKVTKLIDEYDDEFAAQFASLERVSEKVAEKGVSVDENLAAVEAESTEADTSAVAEKPTKNDSPKEGSK